MNIAFYTETGHDPKYDRSFPNCRTDVAWHLALDATNVDLNHVKGHTGKYDLGIIIVPKKKPRLALEGYKYIEQQCKRTAVMQEGPNWYWQDWDVDIQVGYHHLLGDVDVIFCHNSPDIMYYRGLVGSDSVYVLASLMIEDTIPHEVMVPPHERRNTIIGGNFTVYS